jgi:hypothetical protein
MCQSNERKKTKDLLFVTLFLQQLNCIVHVIIQYIFNWSSYHFYSETMISLAYVIVKLNFCGSIASLHIQRTCVRVLDILKMRTIANITSVRPREFVSQIVLVIIKCRMMDGKGKNLRVFFLLIYNQSIYIKHRHFSFLFLD